MKKSVLALFIASLFVSVAEAKPVKKAKKEEASILLRVRVNGKEQKVVNIPMKAKGIKFTINPSDVAKSLKTETAKKPEPKVAAPAATAPSVEDELGLMEEEETPASEKEERTDLVPPQDPPTPADTKKCGTPFYKNGWFWTAVGVVAGGTLLLVARHNGLFDIHVSGSKRH